MGGGGSIQGMLDSLRHNRGQLKKHRKSFRELAESYPAKGGSRGIDLKKATNDGLNRIENGEITSVFFRKGIYQNVISDISTEGDMAWLATNFGIIKVR